MVPCAYISGQFFSITFEAFRNFLNVNRQAVLDVMAKTRLPKSNNPFASFTISQALIKFLKYNHALDALTDFCLSDEGAKKLQEGNSLLLNNARYESAYVHFVRKYLSECKLQVSTIDKKANYDL